jgi:hypothetical protein
MSDPIVELLLGLEARRLQCAVPARSDCLLDLALDPGFGIAPIRVAAEERLQAVAFGRMDRRPQVVATPTPLDRKAAFLNPFAVALGEYVEESLACGRPPRLWLPHRPALEALDVLGHRYRSRAMFAHGESTSDQDEAGRLPADDFGSLLRDGVGNFELPSDHVQRLGDLCYAFAQESRLAGQQAVAIASDLLNSHVATPQSAAANSHLGAQLAWVNSRPGVDPYQEARRRSETPAASLLDHQEDAKVERLRRDLKRARNPARVRHEIVRILIDSARREWDLLVEARNAFWNLRLPAHPDVPRLVDATRQRLAWSLPERRNTPRRPDALARALDQHEYASAFADHIELRGGLIATVKGRRAGRLFGVMVTSVIQPTPDQYPCRIILRTSQETLRVYEGARLETVDGKVQGRVTDFQRDPESGDHLIHLDLTLGVKRDRRPALGDKLTMSTAAPVDMSFRRGKAYTAMDAAHDPLVYDVELPARPPRRVHDGDLLDLSKRIRRP